MQEQGNTAYKLTTQAEVQHNSCLDCPCPDCCFELQPPGTVSSSCGTHGGNTPSSSSNYDSSRRQNQGKRNPLLACWKQLFSTNIHHDQNNN
ncbi:hypothetical protein QN277_011659 [Acacia crassicarpa]|uniref:Uncharacterized protein n=1 Tax=Acacia crassicarpa TaxID=499986 RepID=A0AAE1MZH8_9FABA|nr:hypothetical protein QN277_011659 [Acacia crassicarpa]